MWWHSVASGLCCGARPLRCSPLIKSGERSPTSMNTSNGINNFNYWMEWLWRQNNLTTFKLGRSTVPHAAGEMSRNNATNRGITPIGETPCIAYQE